MADSIVLQFTNDAKVIQFLTTASGTSFARLVDFPLGGGYTVVNGDDRAPIYNPHDDKMYFLATKGGPGTNFLVQYDPRTLAISNEMELPTGWTLAGSRLRDCTDERAWIYGNDFTTRAFDTVSMTQVFTDGGTLNTTPYATTFAMIACGNDVALISDDSVLTTLHRVTVTGPTTFTDATITLPGIASASNEGSYRRRWNENLNQAIVSFDTGVPTAIPGAIIDVAALTSVNIANPGGVDSILYDNGIFWDTFSNKFVGTILAFGISTGIGVFNADGTYVGMADSTLDWSSGSPAMPLSENIVWSTSLSYTAGGAGGFDMVTPGTMPAETFEATSLNSTPNGIAFDSIHAVIAPGTPGTTTTITTVASAGGDIGRSITDTATLSGFNAPTGTIIFRLYGPNDDLCSLDPIFEGLEFVSGNGNYSSPSYTPTQPGVYRWRAFYSGDVNNPAQHTFCNEEGETVSLTQPNVEQGSGGYPGNCGIQFERLEMFHLIKSLMGGGRTLKQAMKFLEQDDIDFIEEEDLLDDLPQEIPKPARQGTSPKMIDRRIDLAPINRLNQLIEQFETKLQECNARNMKRRGQ